MGIDIHWFVERFDNDDNDWEFIDGSIPVYGEYTSELIYNARNYEVYNQLSDFFSLNKKTKFERRGLPINCNSIIAACSNIQGEDAVAHSWLYIDELESLNINDTTFQKVLRAIRDESYGAPIRVVFWFDR